MERTEKQKALNLNSIKGGCRVGAQEAINKQGKQNAQNSRVSHNNNNYNKPRLNLTVIGHGQSRLKTVNNNNICTCTHTHRENRKISL